MTQVRTAGGRTRSAFGLRGAKRSPGAKVRAGGPVRDRALPYLLVLPSVLAMAVLLGWPTVRDLIISLQHYGLREFFTRRPTWAGFANYREVLGDEQFWAVTVRTIGFTAVCVTLTVLGGLAIAQVMGTMSKSVRLTLSSVLVVVWAIPQITATVIFQWLFDQQFGVVNWLLTKLGAHYDGHSWFSSGTSTFAIIVALVVWQALPFVVLSLYASMTSVPSELREAASVDGANARQSFLAVTWPAIKPMVLVLVFLSIIWDFKAFTQIYALKQGGPDRSTTTLSLYAYVEGIGRHDFGKASAISIIMVVLLLGLLAGYLRMMVRAFDEADQA